MKRVFSILVCITILLSMSSFTAKNLIKAADSATTNVVPDENLRIELNKVIVPPGTGSADITQQQLSTIPSSVTKLDLKQKGIANIEGLQFIPSTLVEIDLSNDDITKPNANTFKNIIPLSGTSITKLNISRTNVNDIKNVLEGDLGFLQEFFVDGIVLTGPEVTLKESETLKVPFSEILLPEDLFFEDQRQEIFIKSTVTSKDGKSSLENPVLEQTGISLTIRPNPSDSELKDQYELKVTFGLNQNTQHFSFSGSFTKVINIASTVNKVELNNTIEQAKTFVEADYTKESFAKLKEALTKAEEVLANVNATQQEVDKANTDLKAAIASLVKSGTQIKTEKEKLTETILSVSGENVLLEKDFTPETYKLFSQALTEAVALLDKQGATDEEFKLANENLLNAISNLRGVITNVPTTDSGNKVTATEIPPISNFFDMIVNSFNKSLNTPLFTSRYDANTAQIIRVLDLSVLGTIPAAGENLRFTLASPTEGKKYVLAHYNTSTQEIDSIFEGVDNNDGTFTFKGIKEFSPFILLEVSPLSVTPSGTITNPITGDNINIIIFVVIAIVALSGLIGIKIYNKNNKK